MPQYEWNKETADSAGRVRCFGGNSKKSRKSQLVYCNQHSLLLEDLEGMVIHHIDEDCSNDSPDNLELLTHQEHFHKHPDRARGERSQEIRENYSNIQKKLWDSGFYANRKPRKRLYSDEVVAEILRATKDDRESQVSIAARLGMPRTSVQDIIYKGR